MIDAVVFKSFNATGPRNMDQITFQNWPCKLHRKTYPNDRPALFLHHQTTGELLALVTVNMPLEKLDDDEIIIKGHGDNDGVIKALTSVGVVSQPHRHIRSGYVEFPVCKLLVGV